MLQHKKVFPQYEYRVATFEFTFQTKGSHALESVTYSLGNSCVEFKVVALL